MNVLLIDGSGLAYRSYYAFIRNPLRNTAGEETSLTFGFLNTLLGVLQRYQPGYVAVVFDTPGRNFRHDIDPEYKAGRPPMPESMSQQFPRLRQALALMDLAVLEVPGVEADDVLGTLARRYESRGDTVWVLTADKDFFQILSDRVKLIRFKRVAGDLQEYGPEEFLTDMELRPEQMIDYLALCGDSVDNVPGVAGVGDKTARKLIQDYGSLTTLLDQAADIPKPGLRQKLMAGREDALRSQRLVTINTDLDLDASIDSLSWKEPDWSPVRALLRELEFLQLLKMLPQAQAPTPQPRHVTAVTTLEDLQRVVARLHPDKPLLLQVLTEQQESRQGAIRALALGCEAESTFVVHVQDEGSAAVAASLFDEPEVQSLSAAQIAQHLQPLFHHTDMLFVGSDLKRDLLRLNEWGLHASGNVFDTMVADWMLHPNRRQHDLQTTALEHLAQHFPGLAEHIGTKGRDTSSASKEQLTSWGGMAIDVLHGLYETLPTRLESEELRSLFEDVEMPLLKVLQEIEATGVKVDTAQLASLSAELQQRITELEEQIYQQAGHEFNIQSPRQLGTVLFDECKLPHGKRTKTGWSTDVAVLEKLAVEHELPQLVLEFRQLSKLRSTYTDALPRLVRPASGRIHTSFNQAVASTGRLSSSEPNLQNIPIRTELGRRIRAAFVPESADACLMSADYSQIELRIMAHLSQDRGLLQAFRSGGDIHTLTAARIANCETSEVTTQQRATAKTVNFGVLYGMGPRGLAQQLGIATDKAREFIDEYFATYPGVRAYINHTVDQARTQGFVTTLLGRRLALPDLNSSHPAQRAFAERVAVNAPIQGSAADLIKIAMVHVHGRMQALALSARMILQVHDELLFECPNEEFDALREIVAPEMEGAMHLSVPLVVDIGRGANWEQAH